MLIDEVLHAHREAKVKKADRQIISALEQVLVKAKNYEMDVCRPENRELSDEDTVMSIQKVLKEIKEELSFVKKEDGIIYLQDQINYLESLLPEQLTEEEIANKVKVLKLGGKTMPEIMKHFKEHFTGKCDMKIVSQLARE